MITTREIASLTGLTEAEAEAALAYEFSADSEQVRRVQGVLQALSQSPNSTSDYEGHKLPVATTFPQVGRHRRQLHLDTLHFRVHYMLWRMQNAKNVLHALPLSDAERQAQQKRRFAQEHTFSFLIPLYNTPQEFLEELMDSLQAQTYPHFTVCFADGSDAAHGDVGETVRKRMAQDARFCYRRLESNGGISANTNVCAEMAEGDYIALMDHDDLLHPSALYEVMAKIGETGAEVVYTDEAQFSHTTEALTSPHRKPDFASDNLRANNYICHFLTFTRALFERCGGLRSAFDGSQDHDLVLRLTELTTRVAHVPKILYHWRIHAASVASSISAKPYVMEAGKHAVLEHMQRVGLPGWLDRTPMETVYAPRYVIHGEPKCTVILYGRQKPMAKALTQLLQTNWPNLEILVGGQAGVVSDKRVRFVPPQQGEQDVPFLKRAAEQASGDYLCFLNDHYTPQDVNWLRALLMLCQREDVGAVGGVLCSRSVIHSAGFALHADGGWTAMHGGRLRDWGYCGRMLYPINVTACDLRFMMISATELACLKQSIMACSSVVGAGIELSLLAQAHGKRNVIMPTAQAVTMAYSEAARDARRERQDKAYLGRNFKLPEADPFGIPLDF